MSPQKNIIYIILQKILKTDRLKAYEEDMRRANVNKNNIGNDYILLCFE